MRDAIARTVCCKDVPETKKSINAPIRPSANPRPGIWPMRKPEDVVAAICCDPACGRRATPGTSRYRDCAKAPRRREDGWNRGVTIRPIVTTGLIFAARPEGGANIAGQLPSRGMDRGVIPGPIGTGKISLRDGTRDRSRPPRRIGTSRTPVALRPYAGVGCFRPYWHRSHRTHESHANNKPGSRRRPGSSC